MEDNNKMFALTKCFEGDEIYAPYAITIAISNDKEKLIQELKENVDESISQNFTIYEECGDDEITLYSDDEKSYITYHIKEIKVL